LKPIINNAPAWLSGGNFGLEASVSGLVCVILITLILFRYRKYSTTHNAYDIKSVAS
jgi:uncharacterized protein